MRRKQKHQLDLLVRTVIAMDRQLQTIKRQVDTVDRNLFSIMPDSRAVLVSNPEWDNETWYQNNKLHFERLSREGFVA